MDEQTLRHLTREVEVGHLSRRRFTQILIGLGLTAPMAAQVLGTVGIVHAQPKEPVFTPRQRGGGGPLRTLWWQAPTLLNPHFATGTKDVDASRIFYEPLVAYDPEGNLVPVLAAELPSVANGGLAKDGTTVTWRLKKNVALARRQAVQRRRRDLHVGVRVRPGHRRRDRGLVSRDRPDRQGR